MNHKELEKKIKDLKLWGSFKIECEEFGVVTIYERLYGKIRIKEFFYYDGEDNFKAANDPPLCTEVVIPNPYFDDYKKSEGERPEMNSADY